MGLTYQLSSLAPLIKGIEKIKYIRILPTLRPLYDGPIPIKKAKLNDLLHLKQFLTNSDAQQFYAALKSDETDRDDVDVEYADNIPIDENEGA